MDSSHWACLEALQHWGSPSVSSVQLKKLKETEKKWIKEVKTAEAAFKKLSVQANKLGTAKSKLAEASKALKTTPQTGTADVADGRNIVAHRPATGKGVAAKEEKITRIGQAEAAMAQLSRALATMQEAKALVPLNTSLLALTQ